MRVRPTVILFPTEQTIVASTEKTMLLHIKKTLRGIESLPRFGKVARAEGKRRRLLTMGNLSSTSEKLATSSVAVTPLGKMILTG